MDQLDQFFRKKMEERAPQWDEAYWLEAEKLIEAKERKRKRRVLFWWFSGAFVGLGLLTLAWSYFQSGERALDRAAAIDAAVVEENPAIPSLPEAEDAAMLPAQQGKNADASASILSDSSERPLLPAAKTPANSSQKRSNLSKHDPKTQPAPHEGIPEQRASTTLPDLASEQKSDLAKNNAQKYSKDTPSENPVLSALIPVLAPKTAYLALPLRPLEQNGQEPGSQPIKVLKNKHWQLRLMGTPSIHTGQKLLGGTLALSKIFSINDQWGVEAGLQYRYRTGTFDFSQQSSISSYRFGKVEDRYFLKPSALHYLETPIYIRKTVYKKHTLAIGGSWNYLLGLEGSLKAQNNPEFSFAFGDLQTIKKGWIDSAGYKSSFFSLLARYEYRILPKWQVHLGAQYTPGGMLKPSPSTDQSFLLLESQELLLELGIGIRLFN